MCYICRPYIVDEWNIVPYIIVQHCVLLLALWRFVAFSERVLDIVHACMPTDSSAYQCRPSRHTVRMHDHRQCH